MKTLHTPGPWIIGPYLMGTTDDTLEISSNHNQWAIARIPNGGGLAAANAAAPELLEALERCQIRVFMIEGSENEAYQSARAALAKARGIA